MHTTVTTAQGTNKSTHCYSRDAGGWQQAIEGVIAAAEGHNEGGQ